MKRTLICGVGLLCVGWVGMAQTTIETFSAWDSSTGFGPIGNSTIGQISTFGQVVKVPATDTRLTGFSFAINPNSASTVFKYYAFGWDDSTKLTTSATPLYESATVTFAGSGWTQPGVSGLTLDLTGGSTIILVGSMEMVPGGSDSFYVGLASTSNPYPDGSGYTAGYNGGDLSVFASTAWGAQGQDYVFSANFEAPPHLDAPEAGTVSAGLAVALIAGGMAWRRGRDARR